MALKLKGSTSGFVGLDAPSVAGNNTLILPENSGSAFQVFANDITAGVTTFTQVTVSRNGDLTVPGTISIGGTLTYEDVTSVDSIGIVTARGLSIFGNTTGLQVASGISTFQAVTATTGTFSGDVDIADKIVHTGDTNTAIRFPSVDNVTVETGGTERFRIADAASTFANKLIIDDGSNGHLFLQNTSSDNTIRSGTTGFAAYKNFVLNASQHIFKLSNTEKVRIDSSGRLLVGTTETSSNQSGALNVFGTDGNTAFVSIRRGSNNASGPRLAFGKSRNTTDGAASGLLSDGDILGTIHFYGNDSQGFEEGAAIAANIDGTPGSNDLPTRLTFSTTPDGSDTKQERVRIDSAGRLLVNRTSAYASSSERVSINGMTSIQGSSTSAANLYIFNTDTTGSGTVQPYVFLHDGSGIRGGLGLQYSTSNFIINAQNVLQLRTGSSGVGGTERLRITASGGVLATLGSNNSDNFDIQGHASQGRVTFNVKAGNTTTNASTSIRLSLSNGNQPFSAFIMHDENHANIMNAIQGGMIKFHVNESGSSLIRNVMTDTGHFVNCRGSSGRIAFGTSDGTLYSGMGRYDGAAQDVGLSLYATTNAGVSFVEHFRMEHNGTLKATDTSIGSLSDSRLKKNIADYSYDISKFKQFKPKSFDWINPEVHGDKSNVKGFIAQDIETVDGDWVEDSWIKESDPDFSLISDTTTTNGAGETVGISKISKFGYKDAMYISVVQQLISRIETLEAEIAALKGS